MPDEFNLLAMLEGRKSEDLATEFLAYLLKHPQFRNEQQLFYEELLKDGNFTGTTDRAFEVSTQVWRGSERPDLRILGTDVCILLENKFTAGYTYQQLSRYARRLREVNVRKKVLVLLCPEIWRYVYVKLAAEQFDACSGSEDDIRAALDVDGIEFKVLTWDRLLELFGEKQILTAELSRFVRSRYLRAFVLSDEDVARLMTREIPDYLELVFLFVDNLYEASRRFSVQTSSPRSGSPRWYWFTIEKDGWKYWLGYSLLQWKQSGKPIVLQIMSSPTNTKPHHYGRSLEALGFTQGYDEFQRVAWYWAVPFRANDKELAAQAASDVCGKCASLATAVPEAGAAMV
jgi:hypothetical protein